MGFMKMSFKDSAIVIGDEKIIKIFLVKELDMNDEDFEMLHF